MSDDPLKLDGLLADVSAEAIEGKKQAKKGKDPAAMMRAETAAKREERLASKDSAPPAAPPPPQVQVKPIDKSALLDKLEMYRERFPNLKSRNKLTGKSSTEEVEDELHYVEQQLGQKEGHMGPQLFLLAMTSVENVTMNHYNPLGLNLSGLSNVPRQNMDQFAPILDELFIKYGANMYVGPEMRLAMATATLIYTVHAANNGNPSVAEAMTKMNKPHTPAPTDL